MSLFPIQVPRVPVVAILIAALGCQQSDQIHSYDAPKEVAPPVAAKALPVEVGEPTDRMLVGILPDGGRAWFFKVVGPIAAIAENEKSINDFLTSVRLAPQQAKPEWKLPEGWSEQPGNAMRAATVVIPTKEKPLELTVTTLPWTGAAPDLLSNVNRWRGQLQLGPAAPDSLGDTVRELAAGDVKMTIVDLRGQFKAGGMTPPFAGGAGPFSGGAGTPPGASAGPDGQASLPPGHPPIGPDTKAPAQPAADVTAHPDAPKFAAPDSWKSVPADGFSKATFRLGEGDSSARVTVSDFSTKAGPSIAEPLPNVNRWRREVGLPEATAESLKDVTEQIEVDGNKAVFMAAIPDAADPAQSQSKNGTLAAMVTAGDRVWFFKLTGNRETVAGQRDNFMSFLKSVRFSAEGGAGDGNK